MAIKNNKKLIKLKLGNIGANGDTVATIDSETISVFGGIPGEVVLAEITEQTKTKRRVFLARFGELITCCQWLYSFLIL